MTNEEDNVTDERQDYEEMKRITRDYVCGECGKPLAIHTKEGGGLEVWCPSNKEHRGYVEQTTYTQEFRRGVQVHPAIRDNIERKMMPLKELERAFTLLTLRYPDAIVDQGTAALFVMECIKLDLDPLLQPPEAVPVPFKSKKEGGRKTVAMIITSDGWLSMAARACNDLWIGPPRLQAITDKGEVEQLCGDRDAFAYAAYGPTSLNRDLHPDALGRSYGCFTQAEWKKAKDNKLPAGEQPGNQARRRAVRNWVRDNFPQCRQRMSQLTAAQPDATATTVGEIVDAEYSVLPLGHSKKPKPQQSAGPGAKRQSQATQRQGSSEAKSAAPRDAQDDKDTPAGGGETGAASADAPPQAEKSERRSAAGGAAQATPASITPADVPDLSAVYSLAFQFWKMQPADVCRELGYRNTMDAMAAGLKPWEAWLTIKSLKAPQESPEDEAEALIRNASEAKRA